MLSLGVLDYVVIVCMLAASAVVGIYFRLTGGRQKTTEEFLMAGGDMDILPVAFSIMATSMTSTSMMGIPAEVYLYGFELAYWSVGFVVGCVIAAYVVIPVYFDGKTRTSNEYVGKRFGKVTRTTISLMFMLQMIAVMSVILYSPSLAISTVTGQSEWTSIITLAAVCTFYCTLGGLKAVLWTDVLQAVVMLVAVIALTVKAAIDAGGITRASEIAYDGGRLRFGDFSMSLTKRYTFWNCTIYGFMFGLSYLGTNQVQIQRLLSVRSLERAQKALLCSIPLSAVFFFLCTWTGVMVYSLFHECDPLLATNSGVHSTDQMTPYAIVFLFHDMAGISGICMSGLLASSLSTISSSLNSLATVTMEDYIKPYCLCRNLTESWATFIAKVIAIMYGGVCLLLVIIIANFRAILQTGIIFFGLVAGPSCAVFMLGMFTTTANESGTLFGLLVGFAFQGWLSFCSLAAKVEIPSLPRSVEGCQKTYSIEHGNITSLTSNVTSPVHKTYGAKYSEVFPLYAVSYVWFTLFGFSVTLLVGYTCSCVTGCFTKKHHIEQTLLSPAVRKWLSSSSEQELSKQTKQLKTNE